MAIVRDGKGEIGHSKVWLVRARLAWERRWPELDRKNKERVVMVKVKYGQRVGGKVSVCVCVCIGQT